MEKTPKQLIEEETRRAEMEMAEREKQFKSTAFKLGKDQPSGKPIPKLSTNCTDLARAKKNKK